MRASPDTGRERRAPLGVPTGAAAVKGFGAVAKGAAKKQSAAARLGGPVGCDFGSVKARSFGKFY